jgi:hypothetical protein
MSHRLRQAALLILLAALAAVGVATLGAGTPPRIAAGLALALVLPWLAATRLGAIRASDRDGARLSGAGALTLALVILLGLLLSAGRSGIDRSGIVVGMVIVNAGLALLGVPSAGPLPRLAVSGRTILGLAMTALAVAIAVAAFAIARDRALEQADQESSYAAFLLGTGSRLGVGLTNPTKRPARFAVHDLESGREVTLAVPAGRTRVVRDFLAKPPPLRPRERVLPREVRPVRIRIRVRAGGRPSGKVLQLSTYAR